MTYTRQAIEKILKQTQKGSLSPEAALSKLKNLPYETLSCARVDHHRVFRKGFPEAVYAPGKSLKQLEKIVASIQKSGHPLIVTRLEQKEYRALKKVFKTLKYHEAGRLAFLPKRIPVSQDKRTVGIVTAGTSDLPVAEEAAVTLELTGRKVGRFYDCGVAGLHRLLDCLPELEKHSVLICIAGMEGALASVVAGLMPRPVVGVPTSVGYGAHFEGLAPLLGMLNTCSQGLAVVNIDNGYGAACFAEQILSGAS